MKRDCTFDGFESANTTPVPDVLFDVLLPMLSGAELKVLLYIIRRTRGFKKEVDAISFSQFEKGIITRDGKILDRGCGLSRETISTALHTLEAKGCIESDKRDSTSGDKDTTLYRIHFKEVVGKSDYPVDRWSENLTTLVGKSDYGSQKIRLGVVGKSDQQETVLQQTDSQETVIQEESCAIAPRALDHSCDEDCPCHDEDAPTEARIPAINVTAVSYSENDTRSQQGVSDGNRSNRVRGGDRPGDRGAGTHPGARLDTDAPDAAETAQAPLAPGQQTIPATPYGADTVAAGARAPDDAARTGPPNASESRASSKRGKPPRDAPIIPPEAIAIMDEWDALFKAPQPRTEKHVQAAIALVPSHPTREELKACKAWLFTTDNPQKPWFRRIGVKLQDVANNYGAWQSVQPEQEAEQELEPYSIPWFIRNQELRNAGLLQA